VDTFAYNFRVAVCQGAVCDRAMFRIASICSAWLKSTPT